MAPLLEFLKAFQEGDYWQAIRARQEEELVAARAQCCDAGLLIEEIRITQGKVQGLEFDPVQTLIEELTEQERKRKEDGDESV